MFSICTRPFSCGSLHIDFVAEIYPDVSIKGGERSRCANTRRLRWTISSGSQKCPAQRKSLAVGANKTDLVSFLVAEWSMKVNIYAPRLHSHYLIVTCKEACTMLFSPNGTFIKQVNMPELCSSHEEADTCLLLHAAHASHGGFNTVVIRSPDTNVAILALFFSCEINSQLFFRTGTKNHAASSI